MSKSEDLIRAVQKFRSIWDIESPDYHSKSAKEDAWTMVARILIHNWESLNKSEKFMSKTELKKKWNNMRDYYKKLLVEQQSGNVCKRKKYIFADALHFLKPTFDKGNEDGESSYRETPPDDCLNQSTSFDSEEEELFLQPNSNDEHQEPDKETITFVSCPNDNLYIASGSKLQYPPPPKRAKLKETPSSRIQRDGSDQEDADFFFLRSLLPDMKRLTDKQKFEFKFGVMELYKKITDCGDSTGKFILKQEVCSTQESDEDDN